MKRILTHQFPHEEFKIKLHEAALRERKNREKISKEVDRLKQQILQNTEALRQFETHFTTCLLGSQSEVLRSACQRILDLQKLYIHLQKELQTKLQAYSLRRFN